MVHVKKPREKICHLSPSRSPTTLPVSLLVESCYLYRFTGYKQTNNFFLSCLTFWQHFLKILILITVLMFEVDQFKTCNWFVKIFLIYPISVFTRACHVLYMHADVQRRELLGHDMRSPI